MLLLMLNCYCRLETHRSSTFPQIASWRNTHLCREACASIREEAFALEAEMAGAVASPLGLFSAALSGTEATPLLAIELLSNTIRGAHYFPFLIFKR